MKNHTEKKEAVLAIFKAYRMGQIDKYELEAYLKDIQYQLYIQYFEDIEQTNNDEDFEADIENLCIKNIWFRFFKGDTLATTIRDIISALDCPTNKKHILRNLDNVIIDKQLEIYFS
jgi:hypothetical protein